MATYGFKDVKFQIDDSVGGSLTDLSGALISINGIAIQDTLEEAHTAGDSWVKQLSAGLKRGDNMTLQFFYDDTLVKPIFVNSVGQARSVEIDTGADTLSGEVVIQRVNRIMARGVVTKIEVVLVWDGTITES